MKRSISNFARNFIAPTLVVLLMTVACTKKREPLFAQGQGSDLDSVDTWRERLLDVDTENTLGTSATTNAEKIKISDDVKIINHFDLVKFTVKNKDFQEIIGTPPFRGRPQTSGVYQIKVKLTDDHLAFYKVAKKSDFPSDEYFYIDENETLEDGRVSIPLIAYKIKGYYKIENERTSDDQVSHHLIEVETQNVAEATHVRIDWSTRELFEPTKKLDLLPAELFFARVKKTSSDDKGEFVPYEWYYSETVTEKALGDSDTIIGSTNEVAEKSKLSSARKVIFAPREKELRIVNIARDERMTKEEVRKSADLKSEAALIIPVKWKMFQMTDDGTGSKFKNKEDESQKWDQRDHFEADLTEVQSTAIAEGKNRLLDLEIDTNYLSFTVMNVVGNRARKIHYSFLRADQGRTPYQPRLSFESDRNTFGFFTTLKPFINNWEYYTKDNYRSRVYMNRINPAKKEIVFHLSSDSPSWLDDVTQKSVEAWNKAFAEALGEGKIAVRFSNKRVALGDLRYNVIHLVDTLDQDGLLGFGPSIADPETGEIIAASTNVYISSIQSIAAQSVRQYMINRLEGRSEQAAVLDEATLNAIAKSATVTTSTELVKKLENGKLTAGEIASLSNTTREKIKLATQTFSDHQCEMAGGAGASATDRDIQQFCPKIDEIIARNRSNTFTDDRSEKNWESLWNEAKADIRDCSQKITRGKLLSTLIHEIGHNLGLRHNFYGSYDKQNFKKMTTLFGDEVIAQSSSIMEYTNWDQDRLTETGLYDIAAIRFGYGDAVELKDGTLLNVSKHSIKDALASSNKAAAELKPYLFCTDEDAYLGMNALCRTHDAGTTPKEIAEFYINEYKKGEHLRRFRRAQPNAYSEELVAAYQYAGIFAPLRAIYDQWRLNLGEYVRKSNRYLTDFDSKSYAAALSAMANDPEFAEVYQQYFETSQLIFDFLKGVAFQNNQYCIVEDGTQTRAIEFVRLRDLLSEASRGSLNIRNCAEAIDSKLLANVLVGSSPKIVNELGYPAHSYRFTKISTIQDLADDVMGNATTRKFAFLAMTGRFGSAQNFINEFTPSMMDEPTRFEEIKAALKDRITSGVKIKGVDRPQYLYLEESEIYSFGMNALASSVLIPGEKPGTLNLPATYARSGTFEVYSPSKRTNQTSFIETLELNGGVAFAATSESQEIAIALIQQYNKLLSDSKRQAITPLGRITFTGKLRESLPQASTLSTLTLKDFVIIYNGTYRLQQESTGFIDCLKSKVASLTQLDQVAEVLIPAYQAAQKQGKEELEKFLTTNLASFVKSKLKQEIAFTSDNLSSIDEPARECALEQNEIVLRNKQIPKDLEAQKSLILRVLSNLANG